MATTQFFTGWVCTAGGKRVQFDFHAPIGATEDQIDAAAFRAVLEAVDTGEGNQSMGYYCIGDE